MISRDLIASAAVMAIAVTAPTPAFAQERTYSFDIPSQDLASAVRTFAKTSRQQISFDSALLRGKRSTAIKGTYSVNDGLSQMLGGSGVSYRSAARGVLVLAPAQDAQLGESVAGSAAASDESANQEIVVTGSNIRGVRNKTLPLTVISKEDIDRSGYSTVPQLIESLPQNFALVNQASQGLPGTFDGRSGFKAQGSSINLRGIGEGTTLTLLNGHRFAPGGAQGASVDVSALPLSAIDGIEILTDGASALYGADAIGGVVNFILDRDFDGAETRVRAGHAAGGHEDFRVSQAFGKNWGTGNVLVSGEYYHRDLLKAEERDFVPDSSTIGSLLPRENNHSLIITGRQKLGNRAEVFADVLYARRRANNTAIQKPNLEFDRRDFDDNRTLNTSGGVNWRFLGDWRVQLVGSYARNRVKTERRIFRNRVPDPFFYGKSIFSIGGANIKIDGSLIDLPGGPVRAAIGGEWRAEQLHTDVGAVGVRTELADLKQNVASSYAEVYVPLFSDENGIRGLRRLELSLAGRYDHYSNFGASLSPQIGVVWEPATGLAFRGSYNTSYKAPDLMYYRVELYNGAGIESNFIPGETHLGVFGYKTHQYKPQTSRNFNVGFDLKPNFAKSLNLTVQYFNLDYKNIIAEGSGISITNPIYSFLKIENPTLAQVEEYLGYALLGNGSSIAGPPGSIYVYDYATNFFDIIQASEFDLSRVTAIWDLRATNLGRIRTRGVDFKIAYQFSLGSGNANLDANATIVLARKSQLTPSAPFVESAGTIYNPPKFRMRAAAGWSNDAVSTNVFWNFLGETTDTRQVVDRKIRPYSTIDLTLAYDFSNRSGTALDGLRIGASVLNLFDAGPARIAPSSSPIFDQGFDPTKGSPLGRVIAIDIAKRW